jgi:hypothetical protein
MSMETSQGIVEPRAVVPPVSRGARVVAVFLAISYAVGAPVVALLEYRYAIFSQRFGYPPWFIYSTTVIQASCVVGLLVERYVSRAAAALSAITLGAIASHLRIGSPLTAMPAVLYTVVQVWLVRTLGVWGRRPR